MKIKYKNHICEKKTNIMTILYMYIMTNIVSICHSNIMAIIPVHYDKYSEYMSLQYYDYIIPVHYDKYSKHLS